MINLVMCGNRSVFDGMLITILSILKYHKETITINVLTMDLREEKEDYIPISDEQVLYLNKIVKTENKDSEVKLIDVTDLFIEEFSNSPNINNNYTPYCLIRLFVDKLDIGDKLIYLDTDVVLNNDIKLLWDINIDSYEYGAVVDYMGKVFKNPHYINSGVLLLNIPMIKKTCLFEKTRQAIKVKKSSFPDQDALNKYTTKCLYLPNRFNEQRKIKENTVVKHFCKGIKFFPIFKIYNVKPWQIDKVWSELNIHNFDDILEKYNYHKGIIGGLK